MQTTTFILPIVDIALLLILAGLVVRFIPGAPTWRERLSWIVLAARARGAAVLWSTMTVLHPDDPEGLIESFARFVAIGGSVLGLLTITPALLQQ